MLLINRNNEYYLAYSDAYYAEESLEAFVAMEVENEHKVRTYVTSGALLSTLLGALSTAIVQNASNQNDLMLLTGALSVGAFISLSSYIASEQQKRKITREELDTLLAQIKTFQEQTGYEPIIVGYAGGYDFTDIQDGVLKDKDFSLTEEGFMLRNKMAKKILDLRLEVLDSTHPKTEADLAKLEEIFVQGVLSKDLTQMQIDILCDIASRTNGKGR